MVKYKRKLGTLCMLRTLPYITAHKTERGEGFKGNISTKPFCFFTLKDRYRKWSKPYKNPMYFWDPSKEIIL